MFQNKFKKIQGEVGNCNYIQYGVKKCENCDFFENL